MGIPNDQNQLTSIPQITPMKSYRKLLVSGFLAAIIAFAVSGCGGDSGSSTGPEGSGFAGSTITINPTITFTDGTNCTYTNTEAGSPFPFSAAPVAGTYTYAPSADFKSGTLTLVLDAPISDNVAFSIRNFAQSGGNVTGFRATYNGRTFPVTVTGGTVLAQVVNNGGGGAGETAATAIPDTTQGTYNLTFFEINSGSNITDGIQTSFTITSNTLIFGAKTLNNPVFRNGNQFEWIFKDGALEYAASINAIDNTLNEINVGSSSTFYGQYKEATVTTTVTEGQLSSGSFRAVIGSEEISVAYPESGPTLLIGDQVNFTIGSGTASFGGFTDLIFDSVNSNEFVAIYKDDLGNGESNLVAFGYRAAGDTTYITNIRITFARKVNPGDGQAKNATYYLGDIANNAP